MSDAGLITLPSNHTVEDTIDRLHAEVISRRIAVFAEINHAAGAASVHMPLRPTKLLIFGNPQAGTPLMQASQTIGIDLPLKMLAWEDEAGKVWLSHNDLRWIARRHHLGADTERAVEALAGLLTMLAAAATA